MVGALPSSVVAVSHDHAELLAAVSLFLVSANVGTSISHYRSRLCWLLIWCIPDLSNLTHFDTLDAPLLNNGSYKGKSRSLFESL